MPRSSTQNGEGRFHPTGDELESLYERFPWLYAFCRDHLFRDDTEKISTALWPASGPSEGDSLLELGCGPGFYARRLAARFEHLQVTGIDRSERQLRRACMRASASGLHNCTFEEGDALALDRTTSSVDAVVVSRLFIVLATLLGTLPPILSLVLFGASLETDFTGSGFRLNPWILLVSVLLFAASLLLSRYLKGRASPEKGAD
jgi:arsenite methyltransferase